MAITRTQKEGIVIQVKELIQAAKLTLIVDYRGVTVAQFQALRSLASDHKLVIRVIKNNLVRKALEELKIWQNLNINLNGMLVYVFSTDDEVIGPQTVQNFVKTSRASLDFIGAIDANGVFLDQTTVKQLANLASKPQLIGQLIQCLNSPLQTTQQSLDNLPTLLMNLKNSKIN